MLGGDAGRDVRENFRWGRSTKNATSYGEMVGTRLIAKKLTIQLRYRSIRIVAIYSGRMIIELAQFFQVCFKSKSSQVEETHCSSRLQQKALRVIWNQAVFLRLFVLTMATRLSR